MYLKIKPSEGFEEIVNDFYGLHDSFYDGDSGLDLFCLEDFIVPAKAYGVLMPFRIHASAVLNHNPTGFYIYPRSSTGIKTPIRLGNGTGIIDSGYRGELMAILDNISDEPFTMKVGERYFQICSPTLCPIRFELTSELSSTSRGHNGLGSTTK